MDGDWNKFLGQLDYGFTFIFAIEVLLKVRYLDRNGLPDRNPFVLENLLSFIYRFLIMA